MGTVAESPEIVLTEIASRALRCFPRLRAIATCVEDDGRRRKEEGVAEHREGRDAFMITSTGAALALRTRSAGEADSENACNVSDGGEISSDPLLLRLTLLIARPFKRIPCHCARQKKCRFRMYLHVLCELLLCALTPDTQRRRARCKPTHFPFLAPLSEVRLVKNAFERGRPSSAPHGYFS